MKYKTIKYKFEINKRLLGLNEYINLNRKNKYAGAQAKRKEQIKEIIGVQEMIKL